MKMFYLSKNSRELYYLIYFGSRKLNSLFIKNNIHGINKELADRHIFGQQYLSISEGCAI